MGNLEQIITKQNNIKEKIDEYNRDFELYNKTYIEKFTELKTLKNELKYEKNSVQKDDDKIKVLNFKIQRVFQKSQARLLKKYHKILYFKNMIIKFQTLKNYLIVLQILEQNLV